MNIHNDVLLEGDISPDDFRGLLGELSSSRALKVSIESGKEIFENAGWVWDETMEKAIKVMFGMAVNPKWAKDTLVLSTGYAQYINSLYMKAKKELVEISAATYPSTVPHGQKDRITIKHDQDTNAATILMYYLRNTFYNLKVANDTARTIMSTERAEAQLGI